ncbi:excisionase family protein [Alteromonas sp. BMJM2]|uniref:excisionase family protein n=1 Tax=Alteromonas sp. BMJM2 TaxID=2954241 RepID=UPI0022B4CEB3|nr:excisionase family protein [Alteromonas sp. BMJM2]
MKNQYIKLGWVYPKVMLELKGLTYDSLTKRRTRGHLEEGKHWKKVQGVIMYHYERIDELFEEQHDQVA